MPGRPPPCARRASRQRRFSVTLITFVTLQIVLVQSSHSNVDVTNHGDAQFETSITLDPLNPTNRVVGYIDTRYPCNLARRYDCRAVGVGWFLNGQWSTQPLREIHANFNIYGYQTDPSVAAYKNGVFYYAYLDVDNSAFRRNRLVVPLCQHA
jgi:hypothetical protein